MMNPFLWKTKVDVSGVPNYCLIMLKDKYMRQTPVQKPGKADSTTSTAASSSHGVLSRIENATLNGTALWLWFAWSSRWVVDALRS
jgi:hypothetical protein